MSATTQNKDLYQFTIMEWASIATKAFFGAVLAGVCFVVIPAVPIYMLVMLLFL